MKVVVTGGAGFIGSHVVEAMLSRGAEVLVMDNLVTGTLDNLPKKNNTSLHFENVSVVSLRAKECIIQFQPDVLIHLAAQMNVRKSVEDPIYDAEQNIMGMINMLEALRETSCSRLVFSSTGGAIYGEQDYFPADESHPIAPECPYGLSKRCAEMYIEYYLHRIFSEKKEFQATSLRFGNVYGPRQNPKGEAGVVAIFSKRAIEGNDLIINGDGEQTRDFIYVGDVVSAVCAVIEAPYAKSDVLGVYNLGTEIETSVNNIAKELQQISHSHNPSLQIKIIHGPEAPGEQKRSVLTANAFKKKFAWAPVVDIREGLRNTFDSFLPEKRE